MDQEKVLGDVDRYKVGKKPVLQPCLACRGGEQMSPVQILLSQAVLSDAIPT